MGSGECVLCHGPVQGLDEGPMPGSERNQKWVTYREMGDISINGLLSAPNGTLNKSLNQVLNGTLNK